MTQKQKQSYLANWIVSNDTIYDVYKKPSDAKIDIYNYIVSISADMNGTTPLVISYNGFFFTTAFLFVRNDRRILRVDTPTKIIMFYTDTYEDYKGN